MINGLEGLPRSGKSYEAVVYHVLEAVKAGRKVITNLPVNVEMFAAIDPEYRDLIEVRTRPQPVLGTWDADRVPAFKLFEEGETATPENPIMIGANGQPVARRRRPMFGGVWDYYSNWKDKKGRGPLFLIDECHVALPKSGADVQVMEWFRLHGHFNQDVLLITQMFREMDQTIAGLVAILIKVRKADILGDPNSYIRKVYGGYRGPLIATDERKYRPEMFPLYKSHTQGNSVVEATATDVSPFIVKFNRFKWIWWGVTVAFVAYSFWPGDEKKKETSNAARPPIPLAAAPHHGDLPPGSSGAAAAAAVSNQTSEPDLDPFKDQKLHLTGWMKFGDKTHYSFVVSSGGARLFELTQAQMMKAGYTFQDMGDCAGVLKIGKKVKTVICDAPTLNAGTTNAPVVVSETTGRRSDDRGPSSSIKGV